MVSTFHSLGANNLHSQTISHSQKCVFGTSSSSGSESQISELLEHQPVYDAVKTGWE